MHAKTHSGTSPLSPPLLTSNMSPPQPLLLNNKVSCLCECMCACVCMCVCVYVCVCVRV